MRRAKTRGNQLSMSDLGDLLRRARAHKGVTLRDAEKRTRINRSYLAALEAHDFDQLPPQTYARGIVRNYAQYLGLDPAAVLSMYDAAIRDDSQRNDDAHVVAAVQPIEIHGHWAPNFAIIIFMLIISAVIFTWIYSAYLQPSDDNLPSAIAQPTPTAIEQSLLDSIALTPAATENESGESTAPLGDGSANDSQQAAQATATGVEAAQAQQTEQAPTATSVEPTEGALVEETSDEAPLAPDPDILPDDIQVPPGYHLFAVYAEDEVWVQVVLDNDSIALDSVLAAGEFATFLAQTATITSGNAAYVRVYIDGEDWGTLGEPWDAVVTYP